MPNWDEIEEREKRLAAEHQSNIDREMREMEVHERRAADAARRKAEDLEENH